MGLVFSGGNVFDRHFGAFQFVWSSVVASVFYNLLMYVRPRDAYLALILLFFLTLLTTGSTRPAFILRDVFYVGGIGVSIFVYSGYFNEHRVHNYWYPAFMLAGIYGVVNVAGLEVHSGITRSLSMESTGGDVVSLASTGSYFGVLIGFAVGFGIALNEKWLGGKGSERKIVVA
jgi:hypothetical protein